MLSNEKTGGKNWFFRNWDILLITTICIFEAFIFQRDNWLMKFSFMETTIDTVGGWYTEGFQFQNNIDNTPIHAEAFGLAKNAYTMVGRYDPDVDMSKLDVNYYAADHFRILFPFIASFLLPYFSLAKAYLIVTSIHWILTSYSMYYLGWRIFNSRGVGFVASLLCSTSYQYTMLVSDAKGSLFQFSSVVILVSLALYLDVFNNDMSKQKLGNSFLLGSIAGILAFGSIGSAYFLPFLCIYSLITMRTKPFLVRTASFFVGFFLIIFIVSNFTFQVFSSTSYSFLLNNLINDLNISHWWEAVKFRYTQQIFHQIPMHLWIFAFLGLFFLSREQAKIICCMFTTLLFTEFYMLALSSPYFKFGPSLYYLEFIFAIYLLNARFITSIFSKLSGKKTTLNLIGISAFIGLVIFLNVGVTSLPLFGNYYYYYQSARPTPTYIFKSSFFSYSNVNYMDNVYTDLVSGK